MSLRYKTSTCIVLFAFKEHVEDVFFFFFFFFAFSLASSSRNRGLDGETARRERIRSFIRAVYSLFTGPVAKVYFFFVFQKSKSNGEHTQYSHEVSSYFIVRTTICMQH